MPMSQKEAGHWIKSMQNFNGAMKAAECAGATVEVALDREGMRFSIMGRHPEYNNRIVDLAGQKAQVAMERGDPLFHHASAFSFQAYAMLAEIQEIGKVKGETTVYWKEDPENLFFPPEASIEHPIVYGDGRTDAGLHSAAIVFRDKALFKKFCNMLVNLGVVAEEKRPRQLPSGN